MIGRRLLAGARTENLQRLARALGVRDDLPRRELIEALADAMGAHHAVV